MLKPRPRFKKRIITINKPLVICLSLFIISILSRLLVASSFAAKNSQMRDLYVQKSTLEQEVTRLKYDDLRLSSLDQIESRAKTLGFNYQKDLLLSVDLTVSSPLALR